MSAHGITRKPRAADMVAYYTECLAQRDAQIAKLAAALREFLAAVDGRYLVPSLALGTSTVPNPLAAVKLTADKARAALAEVQS